MSRSETRYKPRLLKSGDGRQECSCEGDAKAITDCLARCISIRGSLERVSACDGTASGSELHVLSSAPKDDTTAFLDSMTSCARGGLQVFTD